METRCYCFKLFGNDPWVLQQDSAPAHAAKIVQNWCKSNLPDFISKEQWPSSSPDVNPLDFCMWGLMEQRLNNLKPMSLDKFNCLLQKIWIEIPEEQVRAACEAFPRRLMAIVKAKSCHIEI